jgi:hypothetical protein
LTMFLQMSRKPCGKLGPPSDSWYECIGVIVVHLNSLIMNGWSMVLLDLSPNRVGFGSTMIS